MGIVLRYLGMVAVGTFLYYILLAQDLRGGAVAAIYMAPWVLLYNLVVVFPLLQLLNRKKDHWIARFFVVGACALIPTIYPLLSLDPGYSFSTGQSGDIIVDGMLTKEGQRMALWNGFLVFLIGGVIGIFSGPKKVEGADV